jgi:AAA family ATP:ADP antiporter
LNAQAPTTTTAGFFATLFRCRAGEGWALALSFAYFTLLLASYYMVRPLRDGLVAGLDSREIKYLASLVFFTMLAIVPVFGWLVSRVRRQVLVPAVYAFFALNLVGFAVAFALRPDEPNVARVFYVWVTVFNMFVVSVFWSFMADVWREEQARRLFGVIAAGGSLGGLVGPPLTRALVHDVGVAGIALLAALTLAGTLGTILLLERRAADPAAPLARVRLNEPVGGAILAGLTRLVRSPFLLGIAALIVLGSTLGMFVYIEMARLVGAQYATAAARTAFFADRDLLVNMLAFVLQFAIVGRLTSWFGVRTTLVATGVLAVAAFTMLGLAPALGALVFANVVLRATEFGVAKPARDMVYTVVDAETKYKVKNVIDTAVYRGSDMTSSWAHGAIAAAGVGLVGFAWLSVGLAGVLALVCWAVGTGYRRRGGL